MNANHPLLEPVYHLAEGVTLHQKEGDHFLLRSMPLSMVRLNRVAYGMLERCDGRTPLGAAAENMDYGAAKTLVAHLVERGFLRLKPASSPPLAFPFVSVVVPVRNRPQQIRECVESLLQLEYPANKLEIIVVDDGSNDSTPKVLNELPVRAILNSSQIRAAACRNQGWSEARGTLIAFTDSDCRVDPHWLADLVGSFSEPDVGAVGGLVDAAGTGSTLDRYEASRSPLCSGKNEKVVTRDSPISYLPTCNLIVRKQVLEEIGGFDCTFFPVGEDVDLVWRIVDAGHRVLYFPRGRIHHHHRESLGPFLFRRCQYAASEAQLLKKHPARRRAVFLPALHLAVLGLIAGWVVTGRWEMLLLASGVLAAQFSLAQRRLGVAGRTVERRAIALSMFRGLLGFGQQLLWTASQYYLLPACLLLVPAVLAGSIPVIPSFAAVLAVGATTSILIYLGDRPALHPATFAVLFCLDKVAFQVGTLRGCMRQRTLKPLLPKLVVCG